MASAYINTVLETVKQTVNETGIDTVLKCKLQHGFIKIDLSISAPFTAADSKRIADYLNMAESYTAGYNAAQVFCNYYAAVSAMYADSRSRICSTNKYDLQLKTEYTKIIKKYIAAHNIIAAVFNIQPLKDDTETVKFKSCSVFPIINNRAEMFSGWIFSKYGYTFKIYKSVFGYRVIIPGTGAAISSAESTKAAAAAAVTLDLVNRIKAQDPHKMESVISFYREKMNAAGFSEMIETCDIFPAVGVPGAAVAVPAADMDDPTANTVPAAVGVPGASEEIAPSVATADPVPAAVDDPGASEEIAPSVAWWYFQRIIDALQLVLFQPDRNTMQPFKKRSTAVFDTS